MEFPFHINNANDKNRSALYNVGGSGCVGAEEISWQRGSTTEYITDMYTCIYAALFSHTMKC